MIPNQMHDKIIQLDGYDTCSESDVTSDSDSSYDDDSSISSSNISNDDEFQIPVIVNIFRQQKNNLPPPVWYEL